MAATLSLVMCMKRERISAHTIDLGIEHPGPPRVARRTRPTADATLILRVARPHRRCACEARHAPRLVARDIRQLGGRRAVRQRS
jgi:hypothetical protein